MKTDYQKVIDLFDELGIGYEEKTYIKDNKLSIQLPTDNKKIGGYANFLSEYTFNLHGKFKSVNNWES